MSDGKEFHNERTVINAPTLSLNELIKFGLFSQFTREDCIYSKTFITQLTLHNAKCIFIKSFASLISRTMQLTNGAQIAAGLMLGVRAIRMQQVQLDWLGS